MLTTRLLTSNTGEYESFLWKDGWNFRFNKNKLHHIDYWQDKEKKEFVIRYPAIIEKELRQLVLESTRTDSKDRVIQDLMTYENL